jgi:uncharacterized protein YcgI (DUF1989 family)
MRFRVGAYPQFGWRNLVHTLSFKSFAPFLTATETPMAAKLISAELIPRMQARTFELRTGQLLRLIAIEGKQVGDLTAWNLRDYGEQMNVIFSTTMNDRSVSHVRRVFSGAPYFNEMLTIESDNHGVHWLGGRCNRFLYQAMGAPDHRNCHDNILEVVAPHGLTDRQVQMDTLNVFMNVVYEPGGTFTFEPPVIDRGDYVDFRASIDLLVAISACPNEGNLRGEINDYVAKSLKVQIYDS